MGPSPGPSDEPPNELPGQTGASHVCPLSLSQCRIAHLVARGLTNRQISDVLPLPSWAVATQIESILERLELRNRVQLAVWAIEHGLGQAD